LAGPDRADLPPSSAPDATRVGPTRRPIRAGWRPVAETRSRVRPGDARPPG
jgi:hypothetical protein